MPSEDSKSDTYARHKSHPLHLIDQDASPSATTPLKVGVFIFDNVELLDFAGPLEVLSHPGTGPAVSHNGIIAPLFTTYLLSDTPIVTTRQKVRVVHDVDLDTHISFDVLVIPGGEGRKIQQKNERVLKYIREFRGKWIVSVCTGSIILAAAGALDGLEATTHHLSYEALAETGEGKVKVVEDRKAVISRHEQSGVNIITAGGVSSGMDAALELIKIEFGEEMAVKTARYVEYEWKPL